MSQQPVEANVVLTADTSNYDSAMSQSATNTDMLGKSVDSLGEKLDHLAKSAGKKLMGFAAVDVSAMTAATVAYGAFEDQMKALSAQAAITTKTMEGQKAAFGSYTSTVNSLRSSFAMSTNEAAQLTQAISRVTDGTASVEKLAKTFSTMGAATGESTLALQ